MYAKKNAASNFPPRLVSQGFLHFGRSQLDKPSESNATRLPLHSLLFSSLIKLFV